MNDASVREAVERIKQGPAVVSLADFAIVAHAALPLFDETPIDKAWLVSVGGLAEDHPDKITFCRPDAMAIGLWNVSDGWKAMMLHTPDWAGCVVRGLKSRGQLRLLALALGIPLTETDQQCPR
jgi:hypothetical protein